MSHPYLGLQTALREIAPVLQKYLGVQTTVGGGMHAKAAALWAYLLAVQRTLGIRGDCVEIGVFHGWGSYLPAQTLGSQDRVVLVDIAQHYLDKAGEFLGANTAARAEQVVKVLVDSAAGRSGDKIGPATQGARWIHIDGEHSYAAVIRDLDTSAQVALPETIIAVDDVDHALAPCINDALLDWLRENRQWRMLLRGYNKAYLVSSRSKVDWQRFIEILPEVFERFFSIRTVLASQSSSADSSYFSYGEGFNDAKYLKVNKTSTTLEDFEGESPRAYLLGASARPGVLLFGNCQMQVLHYGLTAAFEACGMHVSSRYVADVHEMSVEAAERARAAARESIGLVTQIVHNERFAIGSHELEKLNPQAFVLRVPSMHFNAYWPNHADLRTVPGSTFVSPTDVLAYLLITAGVPDSDILPMLSDPGLYGADELQAWARAAGARLRERETNQKLDVRLAQWLEERLAGERLFYTFNHPRKAVLDEALAQLVGLLGQRFAPRHRDVFNDIVARKLTLRYDMSTIDFIDFPPLTAVQRGLQLKEPPAEGTMIYRHFRPRGSGDVHRRVDLATEVRNLRGLLAKLSDEDRAFNLQQILATALVPAAVKPYVPPAPAAQAA